MQVILLDKIENLGGLGDLINVRAGYARNYLLPQGFAKLATEENIKIFEERRAELEKEAAARLGAAQQRAAALENGVYTIAANAGTEGKLFGSVGADDVAKAITEQSPVEVAKREVRMPSGAIRNVGEFEFVIHLHSDVDVNITINVISED